MKPPKYCHECGKLLSKKCIGFFCNSHRDRTGIKNPFYGKTHSKETIETAKIKCRKASKQLWEDPAYRSDVIKKVSKPRRQGFKKEQSDRVKQWYRDNPNQISLRSYAMKKSWAEHRLVPNKTQHNPSSKAENIFFNDVKKLFGKSVVKESLFFGSHWLIPDVLIKDFNFVIEYYGDYWHANPNKYKADDIVHHNKTAKEIWDRDSFRLDLLKTNGYTVHVVWQSDYKKNKECILEKLIIILNGFSCLHVN
jgi:hypothetical protein